MAQTFLLPTAQLQTAPAHREQLVVCSRQSLRLVSLPLFTFLKTPSIIIKHHLSWTFQSHGVISHEISLFSMKDFLLLCFRQPWRTQHKKKIHTECSYSLRTQLRANKFPLCLCVCLQTLRVNFSVWTSSSVCCKLKDQQNLAAIFYNLYYQCQ